MVYTQKQIDNDRKHYLKEQIENANQLLKDTQGTEICWEISCFYDGDVKNKDFEDGILTIHGTEQEAIDHIKAAKEDSDTDLFYRPVVIDADDGSTVTFQNLHYYKKSSYFVKSLNNYINS